MKFTNQTEKLLKNFIKSLKKIRYEKIGSEEFKGVKKNISSVFNDLKKF